MLAGVTDGEGTTGVGGVMLRLWLFAVDEMALSGCALVLMGGADSASVLASVGPHAQTVTTLQMELGEGPCIDAYASRIPVLLPDLADVKANRWPAFASAASAAGVAAG